MKGTKNKNESQKRSKLPPPFSTNLNPPTNLLHHSPNRTLISPPDHKNSQISVNCGGDVVDGLGGGGGGGEEAEAVGGVEEGDGAGVG